MIKFKVGKVKNEVIILKDGKNVGRIFSPSGSGRDCIDGVQICGFSEAFDYWGCGVYGGFKDIQLLYSDKKLGGQKTTSVIECIRCYRKPCQCEVKETKFNCFKSRTYKANPFKVKRSHEVVAGEI